MGNWGRISDYELYEGCEMENEEVIRAEKEGHYDLKRVIMEMDPESHNRFKAACSIRGLTMREVLVEFMGKFSDETFPKERQKVNEPK